MNKTESALRMALEALKSSNKLINGTGTKFGLAGAMDGYYSGCFDVEGNNKLLTDAITAIKEALAQPEQEPVVGTKTWFKDGKVVTQHLTAKDIYKEPQRTWVGLTRKEVHDLYDSDYVVFHKRIEAKLRSKNGY